MCHPRPSSPNGVRRIAPLRRSLRHLPSGWVVRFSLRLPFPECFASWLLLAHPFDLGNLQLRSGRKRLEPTNAPWGPPQELFPRSTYTTMPPLLLGVAGMLKCRLRANTRHYLWVMVKTPSQVEDGSSKR